MIEFQSWPKTPRLFRDMVVTEKIDGTNAAVIVEVADGITHADGTPGRAQGGLRVEVGGVRYIVGAQSRNRLIDPEMDNAGFARWTYDNAESLADILGPGRHFGEWWGSGIQRGYGLPHKRFSLFNVRRYGETIAALADDSFIGRQLDVVPTLAVGPFDLDDVRHILRDLEKNGSKAAPGFHRPEGVVVYHAAAGQTFKALIENDEQPKGIAA